MSLSDIQKRIAEAARTHGREVGEIALIAVSKVQPNDRVAAVLGEAQSVDGLRLQLATGGTSTDLARRRAAWTPPEPAVGWWGWCPPWGSSTTVTCR